MIIAIRYRYLRLYIFFLRHPLAVQGEGPSNGDGLASLCASETLVYPFTRRGLHPGPLDRDYWMEGGPGSEGKPRLRDMFHDKVRYRLTLLLPSSFFLLPSS